jgi:hypothetical protein
MEIENYGLQHNRNCQSSYWYFWAYYSSLQEREAYMQWLAANIPNAEVIPRYNSGNPMVETSIFNEEDLALYKLAWGHTWV